MQTLLEVKNLATRFYTKDGVVKAVNGISYTRRRRNPGHCWGERLWQERSRPLDDASDSQIPPGKIEEGEVWFGGRDLLKVSEGEMHHVRGAEIAMVFQDPMTSLNPVFTVGFQIMEALKLHQGMDDAAGAGAVRGTAGDGRYRRRCPAAG